jgi:hypothetical protein
MGRGIGKTAPLTLAAAIIAAAASAILAGRASAADTPTANARFGEHELLETARKAATATESRPVNIGMPPADELRVLEVRREAELKRLSEKLKRAADARGSKPVDVITQPEWATEIVASTLSSALHLAHYRKRVRLPPQLILA